MSTAEHYNKNKEILHLFDDYPDLLTMNDLQKALGVGRTKAYQLVKSGAINHIKIGKAIRIPKQYLIDFVTKSCYSYNCSNGQSVLSQKGA